MFLEIAVVILSLVLIILAFLLFRQKQRPEVKSKIKEPEPNLQDRQLISLASRLEHSYEEIQRLKE